MKKIITLAFVSCIFLCVSHAQEKITMTDFIKINFSSLPETKKKIDQNNPLYIPAFKQLIQDADKALKFKPVSVMSKTDLPPSGNKHDYMSLAPYWWPNPKTANGLPYIRKDGEINPEVKNYPDKVVLPKLCSNIYLLSLAYYFSGNEAYANHASQLIKVWFLDEATKMNPNVNYGQAVKGVTDGRAEGLIDTRHFMHVVDAIKLIKTSSSWTSTDQKNMYNWVREFSSWMISSEIGKDEMSAPNNHGVWFDAQLMSYAIFLDDKKMINDITERVLNRMDKEMDDEGSFPLEMARTTSLHYSVFILNAYTTLASQSEQAGLDLWNAKTKSGKSLKLAFDFLMPYLLREKKWTAPQIKEFGTSEAFPVFFQAEKKYGFKNCTAEMKKIAGPFFDGLLLNLL